MNPVSYKQKVRVMEGEGNDREKKDPKMRENPAISDWVPCFGKKTEGMLGGWLAQRQAALREVMAAGARFISC
jgi:hypothetical protein